MESLLSRPGDYPYTRGIASFRPKDRPWTMRLFSGFGTPAETNRRFRYLLSHGQTGLSTAFDLPTLLGYDSDDPLAKGEVGKDGVAVDTLEDVETIFDGIPLDKVTVSMTINSAASVLLAMYTAMADRRSIPRTRLSGTIQNDVLKEYMAQNTFIFPPRHGFRLVIDSIAFAAQELPRWYPVSVSGYHIREAGATAAQELAFTLADGFAYLEGCLARGMDVDAAAPGLSFFFNAHNNFFEEIAKFRAARRIWATTLKEKYGAKDRRSLMLKFHAQTSGVALTAQQPMNNLVRAAVQSLAAVLGGAQSLHTNAYDEALALPTEEAARLALRTQQIIAHESGLAEVIDGFGGASHLESLTDHLEQEARRYFAEIASRGGVLACVESGWFMREIQTSAHAEQAAIDAKKQIVVGVNAFMEREKPVTIHRVSMRSETSKIAALKRLKTRRDPARVRQALDHIRAAAEGRDNVMPALIEAVKVPVTLGEICNTFRAVFGEYRLPSV